MRGFTLVEVLLTVIIIGVGLFGIMVMFENASRSALEADVDIVATNLVREKLEKIISDKVSLGYSHLTSENYPTENLGSDFSVFSRSTEIAEVSKDDLATVQEGSGCKRVVVTVTWGPSAREHIAIPTILTSY